MAYNAAALTTHLITVLLCNFSYDYLPILIYSSLYVKVRRVETVPARFLYIELARVQSLYLHLHLHYYDHHYHYYYLE